MEKGEILSLSDGSLKCSCGGEVESVKKLTCIKCGPEQEVQRCAAPEYECSHCDITIGQVFFYKCPACKTKYHCREVWGCNGNCIAEFKCKSCGGKSKEQVKKAH